MWAESQQSQQLTTLRRQHLRWYHGALNVAWLLLMHGALLGWLWYGRDLAPYAIYLAAAVGVCLVHQRLLSEWFHEATHWNLVPDRNWNDRLANLLMGTFNGSRVEDNRSGHFRHHALSEFFTPDDPDTRLQAASTRGELLRGIARDLCGQTAIRVFLGAWAAGRQRPREGVGTTVGWVLWLLACHGAGLAVSLAHHRYEIYPLYYLTLLSLYPVVNRFRLYGQHAALRPDGSVYLAGSRTSRTVHAGRLEQLLLNSPVIMYHFEHHAWPGLPYRALRAVSKRSQDPNQFATSGFGIVRGVLAGIR
jgi:fatty acid desaturase